MHRYIGLRAWVFVVMTALLTTFFAGCGAHGGARYASDVDDLQENIRLSFRVDVIGTHKGRTVNWQGSGVVLHTSGYILTNAHVVNDSKEISIAILEHGKTVYYPAKVVYVATEHDVAIVKIERQFDSAVTLADDDDVEMLANVYTVGFPRNLMMTGARGEIARVGVSNGEGNDVKDDMLVYIEGGPGSSGSGIFLTDGGELVGLVKMVMVSANRTDALLGALVAEPVSHIRKILNEAKIPYNE